MKIVNRAVTRSDIARARMLARKAFRKDDKFDITDLPEDMRRMYEAEDEEGKERFRDKWITLTMDDERELAIPAMIPQPERAARNLKGIVYMIQQALLNDFPFVSFAQEFYVFSDEDAQTDGGTYYGMTTSFSDDYFAIGIAESVLNFDHGVNQAVLTVLHEFAHIIHHGGGTNDHSKEFEELLDSMIAKFNEVHGMNIENDYANYTG